MGTSCAGILAVCFRGRGATVKRVRRGGALVVALVAVGLTAAPALAATGDLSQKPGQGGCIRSVQTSFPIVPDPLCADSTGGLARPLDVVVSPDGRNAYAASQVPGGVAIFDRDPATGVLTQKQSPAGCISAGGVGSDFEAPGVLRCQDGRLVAETNSVMVSPDGRNVYTTSLFGVAIFDRNTTTGALTQKQGTAGCISEDGTDEEGTPDQCTDGKAVFLANSITLSPDGNSAYVAAGRFQEAIVTNAVAVFDRDPNTGALTQKQGTAGCVSETGTDGACADGKALIGAQSVTVSPDGRNVYVTAGGDATRGEGSNAVAIFDRNTTTGALTQKEGTAGCVSETGTGGACADGRALEMFSSSETSLLPPRNVTVSPDGRNVYVASFASDAVAIFDRNTTTGALTQKEGTAGCVSETGAGGCADGRALDAASGVAVSPDGENVYASSGPAANGSAVVVFDRDRVTGALSQKGGGAGCIQDTSAVTPQISGCSPGRALNGAVSVTVSPDARNVYVAAADGNRLAIFDREPPPDTDDDGLIDAVDRCPNQPGLASNQGCPTQGPGGGGGGNGNYPLPPVPVNTSARFPGCPTLTANVIRGTAAANTLNGTTAADRIFAGTGNDVVDALAGNDCVDLGEGDDRGQGGLGDDLMVSGIGRDRVSGSAGNDVMRGNSGNDRLDGGRGNDRVTGDSGNDVLLGSFGNDRLHGVRGRDRIAGSRGRDRINGGSSGDRISGGSSGDRIAGDAGNDRINGNSGSDRISGNSGNDRITSADNSRDRVNCGSGRDTVVADRRDIVSRNCERTIRR